MDGDIRAERAATVGAQLKNPSELDRLFGNLLETSELVRMLESRLDPVSHRSPENAQKEGREAVPHIGFAADSVATINSKIRKLLDELAI